MKKVFILITVLLIVITLSNKTANVIIPNNAIRFRVIANSDSREDQNIKKAVRDNLQQDLYPKLLNAKSHKEAKEVINNNMDSINSNIKKTLKDNNNNTSYDINYGSNHFPKKIYKGVEYPEGNYESLVVTLGHGVGKNWWGLSFPPLCLLEGEESTVDKVEYKSFIKELIDKYL